MRSTYKILAGKPKEKGHLGFGKKILGLHSAKCDHGFCYTCAEPSGSVKR
jgi:hypothetical protein